MKSCMHNGNEDSLDKHRYRKYVKEGYSVNTSKTNDCYEKFNFWWRLTWPKTNTLELTDRELYKMAPC